MKQRLFLIGIILLISCTNQKKCNDALSTWKSEAPNELKKLYPVVEEIDRYDSIMAGEKGNIDDLYFRPYVINELEKKHDIQLPELKKWLNDHESKTSFSQINCRDRKIKAWYKHMFCRPYHYQAYLYYSETGIISEINEPRVAKIHDTLSLGNNWYYIVERCSGCGS